MQFGDQLYICIFNQGYKASHLGPLKDFWTILVLEFGSFRFPHRMYYLKYSGFDIPWSQDCLVFQIIAQYSLMRGCVCVMYPAIQLSEFANTVFIRTLMNTQQDWP